VKPVSNEALFLATSVSDNLIENKKQDSAGWLNPVFCGHEQNSVRDLGASRAVFPIFVIAQEVLLVPEIHQRP
jgi:hypothetical protein